MWLIEILKYALSMSVKKFFGKKYSTYEPSKVKENLLYYFVLKIFYSPL